MPWKYHEYPEKSGEYLVCLFNPSVNAQWYYNLRYLVYDGTWRDHDFNTYSGFWAYYEVENPVIPRNPFIEECNLAYIEMQRAKLDMELAYREMVLNISYNKSELERIYKEREVIFMQKHKIYSDIEDKTFKYIQSHFR